MLRWLRKDNAFWDIAVAAMLLNALVQINCYMGPTRGPEGLSTFNPAIWCSVDKVGAAASAQTEDGSGSAGKCTDCRKCTGQAVAVIAESLRAPLATLDSEEPDLGPVIETAEIISPAPYDGRGPPSFLNA